ncbi:MAG: beta-lactamase class [Sphingomonadales bacterium]|jgi:beta-lactamase class A|nr:beta-lactamase class [Sphingomonadales bacterium]
MIERRQFLIGAGGVGLLAAAPGLAPAQKGLGGKRLHDAVAALERRSGGRLGVAVVDTGSRKAFSYRGDERFPLCSTFKFLLAADLLARAERGALDLDRRLPITATHLPNSDFVKGRVGRDASLSELAHAIIEISDNDAANLLLAEIGGPAAVTRFARAIGDGVTRVDRMEPVSDAPSDVSDTTSPAAMAADFERIVLGGVLRPASRATLTNWLVASQTGPRRLRAGLPSAWRLAHKTGTGMHGTSNDGGVIWPPHRPPLVAAVYLTGSPLSESGRDRIIAGAARAVAAAFSDSH